MNILFLIPGVDVCKQQSSAVMTLPAPDKETPIKALVCEKSSTSLSRNENQNIERKMQVIASMTCPTKIECVNRTNIALVNAKNCLHMEP
jgi:acyl-coenzyme A synthetase/AMP-(fatty) acid ligase